jgi:hypothetical protein
MFLMKTGSFEQPGISGMKEDHPLLLTLEDGRRALAVHAQIKGVLLREKYGPGMDYDTLLRILKDREFVRYPVDIVFCSKKIEGDMFAAAERVSRDADEGYVIYLHEYYQKCLDDVPAMVLYHIVTVNYGDFATYHEAEEFGSSALGMSKDEYYRHLCRLVDERGE